MASTLAYVAAPAPSNNGQVRDSKLGQLEAQQAAVADDLRTDVDQLLAQAARRVRIKAGRGATREYGHHTPRLASFRGIPFQITMPCGRTPVRHNDCRQSDSTPVAWFDRKDRCFIASSRPTADDDRRNGQGKDRQRRPAKSGAKGPSGGAIRRSHSPNEGLIPRTLKNVVGNDS